MAKQEANADKGRFIDRDLEQLVFGFIKDRSRVTRPQQRHRRVDRAESAPHGDHNSEKDAHGNPWRSVERVYFVGFMLTDEEYDRLFDRLEILRGQVAHIVDFHEDNVFDRLVAADVNTGKLGGLGSQLSDCVLDKYSFAKLWDDA